VFDDGRVKVKIGKSYFPTVNFDKLKVRVMGAGPTVVDIPPTALIVSDNREPPRRPCDDDGTWIPITTNSNLQEGDECMCLDNSKWYPATVKEVFDDGRVKVKIGKSYFPTVNFDKLKVRVMDIPLTALIVSDNREPPRLPCDDDGTSHAMAEAHVRESDSESRMIEQKNLESRIWFYTKQLEGITDANCERYKKIQQRRSDAEQRYEDMLC